MPEAQYTDYISTSPHQPDTNFQSATLMASQESSDGGHHEYPPPPRGSISRRKTKTEPLPQRPGRYPLYQSSRRRTTMGSRPPNITVVSSPGPTTPKLKQAMTNVAELLVPQHKVGESPHIRTQLKTILFGTWFNVLLLCIPVSWALHFAKPQEYVLVFVFSFLSIMPLAKLLAFATDELSIRVGETLAGLLNATLGNAVELIVAILALIKCELRIVQSSLVGSILSNLLLVLGFCFFAGGTRFSEQGFAISASQLNSSLLVLSVIGVLIPAAFDNVTGNNQISGFSTDEEQRDILKLSHGTAIVLLCIYVGYIYFQLFSHKNLYDGEAGTRPETIRYPPHEGQSTTGKIAKKFIGLAHLPPLKECTKEDVASVQTAHTGQTTSSAPLVHPNAGSPQPTQRTLDTEAGTTECKEDEDEELPALSLQTTVILLIVVTVFVAVTAEWLVDSIDGLASGGQISKEFIGLILLPIVGNAAEHVTAVTVSIKDKLTLSLSVAVGSSIQIALFVIPFTVVVGWIMGHPLTMLFDPFESIILFFAVLTVNYVVQDGKSNWLEGMILICLYVIIALVFWFYPGTELTGLLAKC